MSITNPIVGAIWLAAFGAFIGWYGLRLRDVKEARLEVDRSEGGKQRLADLAAGNH
jgi:hypothetical protein